MQGWNMALKNAQLHFPERAEDIDALIKQRINGSLKVQIILLNLNKLWCHEKCLIYLLSYTGPLQDASDSDNSGFWDVCSALLPKARS